MIVIEMTIVLKTNELKYLSETTPQEKNLPKILTVFSENRKKKPPNLEVFATNYFGISEERIFRPVNEDLYICHISTDIFCMSIYPTNRVYKGKFSIIKTGVLYEISYPKNLSLPSRLKPKFNYYQE